MALALGLAAAPPAIAASSLIDLGTTDITAGPVLAGERVAWGTGAGDGEIDLHASRLDGGDRRSVRVPLRDLAAAPSGGSVISTLALAASERRWALRVVTTHCSGETACKYQMSRVIGSRLMTAPLGEPPELVTGCDGLEACRPCPDRVPALDVSGDAVAYDEPCANAATVHDFAPGALPAERSFEKTASIRVAGRYAAIERDGHGVYDWRTGERLFGIAPDRFAQDFDVQDDGTLAFTRNKQGYESELAWASPAEPFPHPVGVARDPYLHGFAKGRIAFSRQHERTLDSHLGVVALDGTRPALVRPSADFRLPDFDGDRFAYRQRPCTVTAIAVWDITGAPPELPRAQCPRLRLASRTAHADLASNTLSVRLSCPATPRLGCYGQATVTARHRRLRRQKRMTFDLYRPELAPGETKTVGLRLARRLACKFERTGDTVNATIELHSWGRDEGEGSRARRPLRVRGLAACGA